MGMHQKRTLIDEMQNVLQDKIVPFWLDRGVDRTHGGYQTCFNEKGEPTEDTDKYIVTQTRMLWGFSYLSGCCKPGQRADLLAAARQGYDFLMKHFWDGEHGGFFWKTAQDGSLLDCGKLVYAEGFAIYALAEYARQSGDAKALSTAEELFNLLQLYAADTEHGGYFENLERDWRRAPGGVYGGDRKSLDIHMHLMEAYTTLYAAGGREIVARKLREVIGLILRHMVDQEAGYGYNQFDVAFRRIPAINIARTWNAERYRGETVETPVDSTSYGHNVELSWLLDQALEVLGDDKAPYHTVMRNLLDHSLGHGYDYEYGGVYRDGVATHEVLVKDKEWWQNFEALVGYANGYLLYGDGAYWQALERTWVFVRDKFMNMEAGESRQLLRRDGSPLAGDLGNPWKGIYHTGRALAETVRRIQISIQEGERHCGE